jgi:hypothetical protein
MISLAFVSRETSAWATESGSDAERLRRSSKVEQRNVVVGSDDDAAGHDGRFPGIVVIADS